MIQINPGKYCFLVKKWSQSMSYIYLYIPFMRSFFFVCETICMSIMPFFIPFYFNFFHLNEQNNTLFVSHIIYLFIFGLLYANNITFLDATCLVFYFIMHWIIIEFTSKTTQNFLWMLSYDKQIAHFFILFIIHYVSFSC